MRARVGAASLVVLLAAAGSARAIEVSPHRALYSLTLDTAKPSSRVSGATGTLGYQWGEACDGWTIEQRYKLALQYQDEQPMQIESSFVTYESKDGLRYQFNEKKSTNGQPDEEIHGTATLQPNGGPGVAIFEKPKEQTFDLPAGTLFPTAHTLMLIDKGEAHDKYVAAQVFDGSTFDGAVLISAIIGPTLPVSAPPDTTVQSPLLLRPSWTVHLAFFPDSSKDQQPDYELSMRLLANGVSSSMAIDYGDYLIDAALEKIEPLPKPAC